MTLKTSIVTAIAGAALVLVPTAWGKAQPVQGVSSDAVERAVLASELSQRQDVVLTDAFERAVGGQQRESANAAVHGDAFQRGQAARQDRIDFWNYDESGRKIADTSPGTSPTSLAGLYSNGLGSPSDRSVGMNRAYGLGEFATPQLDAFERAAEAGGRVSGPSDRSIGLNQLYGLGEFAQIPITDTHDRVSPVSEAVSLPTVGSGRDFEWPQLGLGFGVGILLALGLWLAVRTTRIRPLAH